MPQESLKGNTAHYIHGMCVAAAGTALGTGLQRLVALVGEVEGGRITLAALHMEHPLLGLTALQQQVQSHYLRAALPELVKLVGSANVLGRAATALAQELITMGWITMWRLRQAQTAWGVKGHGLHPYGNTLFDK